MSQEYASGYDAQQGAEPVNQVYEDLYGPDDFGQDFLYDNNFDFGAYQESANLEFNDFDTAPNPPQVSEGSGQWPTVNTPGINFGYNSAVTSGDFAQGMMYPAPVHVVDDVPQDVFAADQYFGHHGIQQGLPNGADQPQLNVDQSGKDYDGISSSENVSGNLNQQNFPLTFTAEDWQFIEDQAANGDFSQIPDSEYQGPYSHGNLDNSFNPVQPPVDSYQWSAVDTSGMDSAYATASMPMETTHGQLMATPNDFDNAVGHAGPGNMQGGLGGTTQTANPPTDEDNELYEDENEDEEEDEVEDEDEHVNVIVPNGPACETYDEYDPLIVENPSRVQRDKKWIILGRTGRRNGQEVWFNKETLKWQPSASHHDMRATLIRRAQEEYPDDRYLHPDPTDGLLHGETAFFKPHQFRGPDRNDCADCLFAWREYIPKTEENSKRKKASKPKYRNGHPGYMYEGDKILLDPHENPVLNHKFIPLTLSAQTDGAKLQEMALHEDCQQVDLWARMPRLEIWKDKKGGKRYVELRSKNTRINMPMTRFREKKGTIAGGDREGSEVIREGLLKFYHDHGFDPVASGHSVKAFWRDMEPWEVKQTRLGNKAKHGERAGSRAVGDDKREEDYQKTLKSIENGKKRQAARNGGRVEKRPLQNHDANVGGSDLGPRKRVYQEPGFIPSNVGAKGKSGGNSRQGRAKKASSSKTQRYGTLGAVQPPHQILDPIYMYQQPQAQHFNNQYFEGQYRQPYPGTGMEMAASLGQLQQTPQYGGQAYGGQTWPARSPYESNGNYETQPGLSQPNIRQASTTQPYIQQHLLPGGQGQDFLDEVEYNPYVIEENRQRMLRQGMNGAPLGHRTPQNRPVSNINQLYASPSYANNVDTNGATKHKVSSLGPGGRRVPQEPQVPRQILGKRVQHDATGGGNDENRGNKEATEAAGPALLPQIHDFESTTQNGIQQKHDNVQASQNSDVDSTHKRRRNNRMPGTEPWPQRRRQNGNKPPPPKYYGAGCAPEPFLSPEEPSGTTNLTPLVIEDSEGPLMSPEELFGNMSDVFDPNEDTADWVPNSTDDNDGHNGHTYNENTLNLDGDVAPRRHSEDLQRVPEGSEPQQVLGKRQQEEPVGERDQDTHFQEQIATDQQPHVGDKEENNDVQKPKRPRMPATEGYHSPPAQALKAAMVQKKRKAERDAHLPPPQLQINEPIWDDFDSPRMDDQHLTPPQHIYIGGAIIDIDEAPQVAVGQGPDPPQAPNPAQAEPRVPSDIRDVRPANAWQTRRLEDALRYTREAFLEWTGETAPETNLEDCYNVQYRKIRAAFRDWWRSEGNPQRSEPLPELWRMKAWSGAIEDWKAPENREHVHEPIRRGRWAPRNEDGSLQQPEFHWDAGNYEGYDAQVVGQL